MSLKNRPKSEPIYREGRRIGMSNPGMECYEVCFKEIEKKLADLLDDDKVCDDCEFSVYCSDFPYDCNALDKLREIAGKKR